MAVSKLKLELTPYNSMTILSFLREYVNDDLKEDYRLKSLTEAVDELQNEIVRKMTDEQFEDCKRENVVNQLIGKSPMRDGVV